MQVGAHLYACLSCGYRTLPEPSPGSRSRCEVCGWFDMDIVSVRDRWELAHKQSEYLNKGLTPPHGTGPTADVPDYVRDPGWSIDSEPERARQSLFEMAEELIRHAFSGVLRDGAITLTGAYQREYQEAPSWGWSDQDEHWWEIPDDILQQSIQSAGIYSFGNRASYRYYLPAYLTYSLRTMNISGRLGLEASRITEDDGETITPEEILSPEQRSAALVFLEYMSLYDTPRTSRDAAEVLKARYAHR